MRRRKLSVGVVGLGVLGAVIVLLSFGVFRESWYKHRLFSESISTRRLAAQKLADFQCLSAIPLLIESIRAFPERESFSNTQDHYAADALKQFGNSPENGVLGQGGVTPVVENEAAPAARK